MKAENSTVDNFSFFGQCISYDKKSRKFGMRIHFLGSSGAAKLDSVEYGSSESFPGCLGKTYNHELRGIFF